MWLGSSAVGAGGLALALPTGGTVTIPAAAVASAGYATSGTLIAGGTITVTDAISKIAAANANLQISFAKKYDEWKKDRPTSKTIDANKPIEARVGGKNVKLRVDAEAHSGESGKIQIQAGSGKSGYPTNRAIEASKIINAQSAREFVNGIPELKKVPESVKEELVKRVLKAAKYLSE